MLFFFLSLFTQVESTLAEELQIARIEYQGNVALDRRALQRITGVRRYDFYNSELCASIQRRLTRGYTRIGYLNARIQCEFQQESTALHVVIQEGEPQRVASVEVRQGESSSNLVLTILRPLTSSMVGQIVSPSSLRRWKRNLLFALRREGFLFASVSLEMGNENRLLLRVIPRERVQFFFHGNHNISADDLLLLLRLTERTSPITYRAVDGLPELIQSAYEARGYPLASAEIKRRQNSPEGVQLYDVFIDEGQLLFVRQVVFEVEGLPEGKAVSDFIPRGFLQTTKRRPALVSFSGPGLFTRDNVESDCDAITARLAALGYLDAEVRYELKGELDGLTVTFWLRFGRLYQIEGFHSEIRCPSYPEIAESVESEVTLLRGLPASDATLSPVKQKIKDRLAVAGFSGSRVELSIPQPGEPLHVTVDCGERYRVDEVRFEGVVHSDIDYLYELFGVVPGEDLNQAQEGVERLRQSGVFSAVELRLEDSLNPSPDPRRTQKIAVVRVRERDTGVVDTSVSLNTEDGLRIGGELSQRNFRSKGETLGLFADLFFNTGKQPIDAGRARGLWRIPRLLNSEDLELLSEAYLQYDIQNVNQFSFTRVGNDTQVRRRMGSFLLSTGFSIFQDDVFDVLEDVIISARDTSKTLYTSLTGRLEYEGRDNALSPNEGLYSALLGKLSSTAFGADVNLAFFSLENKYYYPLLKDLTWVNAVRGTVIEPFADTEAVPLSQRLYLGGSSTLRGFGRNRLSPLGVMGGRAGGDRDYVLNTELQWNLAESVQLAGFIDAGEVRLVNEGDNLASRSTGFRMAPGFGVRYRTPVGPLGVDIGFPIERREGESYPRVYFGFNGIF